MEINIPKTLTVKHALIGVAVLFGLVGLAAIEIKSSHPTPAAAPPEQPASATTTSAPASSPAPGGAASATPAAASGAGAGPANVVIPGQSVVPGLVPQSMSYLLQTQDPQTHTWTNIGDTKLDARMASFTTTVPNTLAEFAPSDGLVRDTWTFYYQQPVDGEDTFNLQLHGRSDLDASVAIDDSQDAQLTVQLRGGNMYMDAPPASGSHKIDLGAGWHKITVAFDHQVNRQVHVSATGALSVLTPGISTPQALIPSTIDPTLAAQQAAAKAAPTTTVPAAAPQTLASGVAVGASAFSPTAVSQAAAAAAGLASQTPASGPAPSAAAIPSTGASQAVAAASHPASAGSK